MITFEGILIGTGILWVTNALLVIPITNCLVKNKLSTPAYAHIGADMEAAAELPEFNSLVTRSYMFVDALVLGIVGFLMGVILGWFFVGISFEAKGWPGLIAFVTMSMFGASMHI